jgi:hypothetical protein
MDFVFNNLYQIYMCFNAPFRRNQLLEHHNYFPYIEVDLYHCKRENGKSTLVIP